VKPLSSGSPRKLQVGKVSTSTPDLDTCEPSKVKEVRGDKKEQVLCSFCAWSFDCREALTEHHQLHHNFGIFKCSLCKRVFSTRFLKNLHAINNCTLPFESEKQPELKESGGLVEKLEQKCIPQIGQEQNNAQGLSIGMLIGI